MYMAEIELFANIWRAFYSDAFCESKLLRDVIVSL